MINFEFYAPTKVVFGKDREKEVGKLVKEHGGNKVLLHYGGQSAVKSGLLDRIMKSLEEEISQTNSIYNNPHDPNSPMYQSMMCIKSF